MYQHTVDCMFTDHAIPSISSVLSTYMKVQKVNLSSTTIPKITPRDDTHKNYQSHYIADYCSFDVENKGEAITVNPKKSAGGCGGTLGFCTPSSSSPPPPMASHGYLDVVIYSSQSTPHQLILSGENATKVR